MGGEEDRVSMGDLAQAGAEPLTVTDVPERTACDIKRLSLVRDEVYVLSFIDGASSVDDLALLTGRSVEQVCGIVAQLLAHGAIRVPRRRGSRAEGEGRSGGSATAPGGTAGSHSVSPACVPRLTGKNLTGLEIGAQEGFLLSQVDGTTPVSELSEITGTEIGALGVTLLRLQSLGAVALTAPERVSRPGRVDRGPAIAVDVFSTPRQRHAGAPKRPIAARTQPPIEKERTKPPIEKERPKTSPPRTAAKTGRKSTAPAGPPPPAVPAPSAPAVAAPSVIADLVIPEKVPPSMPSVAPAPSVVPSSSSIPEPAPSSGGRRRPLIRVGTDDFRATAAPVRVAEVAAPGFRQTLVGMPPAGGASADPAAPSTGEAVNALRPFFAETKERDGRAHAKVFAEAAEYELARGNVLAAATQFQLAYDACKAPELRLALEAVEAQAQDRRYEMHKTAAESAERDARWADAASAYARVYAVRPGGHIAERLANALRLSSGDLREAVKMADEAVRHDPRHAGYRVTLSAVCLAAKLEVRAQAEAKRAFELAPEDPRVQALVAALAKLANDQ